MKSDLCSVSADQTDRFQVQISCSEYFIITGPDNYVKQGKGMAESISGQLTVLTPACRKT